MTNSEPVHHLRGDEPKPLVHGDFPGPNARRIVAADHKYVARTTKTAEFVASSARNAVVLDVDGNLLLDFAAGIGVLNTGHSHPRVVSAVREQAERLIHFAGTDYYYAAQADLAARLAHLVPGHNERKTFFANSGTEANEAALKVVRWATQRPQVLAFQRGFHGRTMGSLSLTSSKPVQRERFFPGMPGVHTVPYPDPYRNMWGIDGYADPEALNEAVLAFIDTLFETQLPIPECGALFAEPVQGEGGYVFPPATFFKKLKKFLNERGILLVADEVQTGFGRTGKMFAMEHYDVAPDLLTMAKAMASGLPMGACVYDAELDFGASGAHSNTFGGNLLACAAAIATVDVIEEEDLVGRSGRRGDQLGKRLAELQQKYPQIGDARGLGLMRAVDFVKDPKTKQHDTRLRNDVLAQATKRGLILLPAGASAIRFLPPLTVTEAQVDGACEVLEESLAAATG